MAEEEDEFDAIFQEDGGRDDRSGRVKAEAVNYKVSMDKYQEVDIFSTTRTSEPIHKTIEPESRGSKYQVILTENNKLGHHADSEPLNVNNHGNSNETHQSETSDLKPPRSAAEPVESDLSTTSLENGATRDQSQAGYQLKTSSPITSENKSSSLEKADGNSDLGDLLRKEPPRDRAGTGKDPTEQLLRAKAEWEAIGTIQPGEDVTEGNEGSINVTPLISFNETLAFFQRINMQPYLSKIKPTVHRSGFAALRHLIIGPPKVKASLHEERNLVFGIAQCPFDDTEEVHRRVLQTIYKQLTGSTLDCPRYGSHWEQIGFQGVDPATDLRACGFLGLMMMLHLVMDPVRLQVAKEIYRLSLHETQNFPFSVMSINMTRIALQCLREDCLSRECNRRKQVFGVINDFYAGIFLQVYQIWKHQQKTIKDSGFVIKDVELEAKKNPRDVIKSLETYLQGHSEKHGGNVRPGETGDTLVFVGVHELETEDD
ncbi:ELMO domain-containing protein 3-like isoform X1 [Asterias rubens]|uniref:ELMO domain-containing protein 3-like isoform X1 n=1 Tax=Asterias rubens TaxID=7604 RepID=UPI001455A1A8|nr:ELMO domain-containing protein 3-like isoform X1 [Asterias rubens]